jgi:prepilin peptidase CpaA
MQTAEWLVVAWAVSAFISDLTKRRIPNVISFGAILFAAVFLLVKGSTVLGASWQSGLLGAGLGLALTLPGYFMRLLGAGDAKLMLAIGLLGGSEIVLTCFVLASFLAGMLVLGWLFLNHYFNLFNPQAKRWLPFGSILSLGLLAIIGFKP